MSGAVPDMYAYTLYLSYTLVAMHAAGAPRPSPSDVGRLQLHNGCQKPKNPGP